MLAWGTALPQEGTRASQSTHSRAQSEETPWQTTQDSRDDNSWRARWRPEQRWLYPCISIPGGHSRSTRVPAGSRSSSSRCAASAQVGYRSRRPIPSQLLSRRSNTTPSPSRSSRISYTPTSARRSYGATTRSVALGDGVQHQRHLGGIFVVQRGVPIQITFTNKLPPKHILPVDISD